MLHRSAVIVALLAFSAPAWAGCTIHNETGESFTISSGNVSNQRVGSHTTSGIAAGTIIAKADSGKSAGGSCTEGQHVKVVEESGVLVIKPQ
jgi:hypothetical protein